MTARIAAWVAAAALGALSALAVGCGSSSALLPADEAASLKDSLQLVRAAVDDRNCSAARSRLTNLRSKVGNLEPPVDRKLRVRLREEINGKLAPAVDAECAATKTEAVPTVATPAAPTGPSGPTETEPDPPTQSTGTTETTPPPTGTTETTETTPVPPVPEPLPPDPGTEDPGTGEGTGGAAGDGLGAG